MGEEERSPTDLDGAEEARDDANRRALLKRRMELLEFRRLLENSSFRAFLWRLLEHTGCFRCSFDAQAKDSTMAFREGERNVGLRYLAQLNEVAPEMYMLMAQEARNGE